LLPIGDNQNTMFLFSIFQKPTWSPAKKVLEPPEHSYGSYSSSLLFFAIGCACWYWRNGRIKLELAVCTGRNVKKELIYALPSFAR
jgi:hypothetical protein